MIPPPPAPAKPRKTMSSVILLEKPEATLPIMKTAMAKHSAAFLPNMSLKRPYNGWKLVEVSRLAEGTQDDTDPAWNAADMVGRAVATMTESSVEVTMHSASPEKTAMTFLKGSKFVWSVKLTASSVLSAFVLVVCSVEIIAVTASRSETEMVTSPTEAADGGFASLDIKASVGGSSESVYGMSV